MSRDKRDAERAARRATRLAERAQERARRKEAQAEQAERRAARLADRVNNRSQRDLPQKDRDLDRSIEDLVDQVTQKAEVWIDEATQRLFDSAETGSESEREIRRAETQAERARRDAEKARHSANRAERAAKDMSDLETELDEDFLSVEQPRRSSGTRSSRARRRDAHWGDESHSSQPRSRSGSRSRSKARRFRSAHLYRDRQRKKLFGVCAGFADYVGRPPWEIRLYAFLALMFIPSVIVPVYFIAYFLMDDKPHYRRVTDRIEETLDSAEVPFEDTTTNRQGQSMKSSKKKQVKMDNVQAMRSAREKFSDIEQRLRQMETHVTSSRFELQRELKKISGED